MAQTWLFYLLCTLAIMWSGYRLSVYGDIIAEKTGISKMWIGFVLVAFLAALPELSTALSAVAVLHIPDLAVGTLFGVVLYGLLLIAVLDIIYNLKGRGPILGHANLGHILVGSLGIILVGIASLGILMGGLVPPVMVGNVSIFTLVIFLVYLFAQTVIYRFERKRESAFFDQKMKKLEHHDFVKTDLGQAYSRFAIYAIVVVLAGSWLPILGGQIANAYFWTNPQVAVLLLGFSAILPEAVISISYLFIGAIDMAIGALLVSAVFNMVIIFIADLFYPVSILTVCSPILSAIGFVLMMMMALANAGLIFRSEHKDGRRIGWDFTGMILLFAAAVYLLLR